MSFFWGLLLVIGGAWLVKKIYSAINPPDYSSKNISSSRRSSLQDNSWQSSDYWSGKSIGNSSTTSKYQEKPRWYGKDEELRVGGYQISSPLCYTLDHAGRNGNEASCIIIKQKVGRPASYGQGALGYWPSYL